MDHHNTLGNVYIRLALLLLVQLHSDNPAVKRFSDFWIQKLNHNLKPRNDQKDIQKCYGLHKQQCVVLCGGFEGFDNDFPVTLYGLSSGPDPVRNGRLRGLLTTASSASAEALAVFEW